MNRKTIVRGIQLIVGITLATFTYLTYDSIVRQKADLAAGFAHLNVGWLLVAAVLALQEGICGGLRIYVLGRVLSKELRVRTAVISEFVLMFCAGVTPGQVGAPPSQVAVLVYGGMRLVDVATASLLTASCTILFFLGTALLIFVLRTTGHLELSHNAARIDWLLGFSVATFGSGLIGLVLCAAYPPLLKAWFRLVAPFFGGLYRPILRLASRIGRFNIWAEATLAKPGAARDRLIMSVDEFHEGFRTYLRRGKLAYATAVLLTFGFFCSRFAVSYFILLALGIPTTPDTFVTIGPPIVQVVLIQALLNFALYLSPTPGASGVAEAGSTALMSPWVKGPYELPYLVLWRVLALFLCMFVGGIYVFRYLGTDVLEKRIKENEAEKERLKVAWVKVRLAATLALAFSVTGCRGCAERPPPSPGAPAIVQDFEDSPSIRRWPKDAPGEAAISTEWHADGARSLKIDPGVMAVLTDLKVHDFTGYTTLVFQFHNPASAAPLGVEIQDDHTDLRDRHQHTFGMPPGDGRLELDFSGGLFRGEENRPYRGPTKTPIDVSRITRLAFSNEGHAPIYIDAIALERTPRIEALGAFAFDFGPNGSQVMSQTLGITPATRYTPERGYGLLGDHPAALERSMSYPTPLLGDGLGFHDGGFRVDLEEGDYLGWIAFERGGFWEEEASGYRRAALAVNGVVVSEHAFTESGPHFFFEDTELTDLSDLSSKLIWPAAAVQRFAFKARKGGNTFTLAVEGLRGPELRVAGLFLAPDTPAGRAFIDAQVALEEKIIHETFTPQDRSRRGEGRAAPEEGLVIEPLPPGVPVYPRNLPVHPRGAALDEILAAEGQPVTVHLAVYARKELKVHVDADGAKVGVGRYLPARAGLPGPVWIEVSHYRPEADFTVGPDLTRSVVIEIPSSQVTSTITLSAGDIKREIPVRIRRIERSLPEIPIPVGLLMNALPFDPSAVGEETWWRFQEDLLREQARAGLNCLTGGPGLSHPLKGPPGARDPAEEYIALARRSGPVRAVVPYGGFLPRLHAGEFTPGELARVLSSFSVPHYVYVYDEPLTDAEVKEALELISPYTRAGIMTLGFTSVRQEPSPPDALIGETYAPALSDHDAHDIARWKKHGRHVWIYNNGLDRYGMGLSLWRSLKLGAEGRLEWIGLITQGFAFDQLDGREPSPAAWVVHDRLGPMPTPRWFAAREGLFDLRIRLLLEASVPASDPALGGWTVEAYRADQDRWPDEALSAARRAMLERLSRSP